MSLPLFWQFGLDFITPFTLYAKLLCSTRSFYSPFLRRRSLEYNARAQMGLWNPPLFWLDHHLFEIHLVQISRDIVKFSNILFQLSCFNVIRLIGRWSIPLVRCFCFLSHNSNKETLSHVPWIFSIEILIKQKGM